MKNKTKYIFLLTVVGAIFLILGIFFLMKRNVTEDNSKATCFEWMEMLGDQFDIHEYVNKTPYFSDVNSDNPYFSYVQSAVEWGTIRENSNFNGDSFVSGKFIVLTSLKTIGENKLQIYLASEDAITDDFYIKFAIEHELIEKENLDKEYTREECKQFLDTLQDLYFGELWKDNYVTLTYQDSVTEISPKDIQRSNVDCSEIMVTDNLQNSFDVGSIIIIEQENTKLKVAREITAKNSDGKWQLGIPDLSKVVKTLTVSDIEELTFDDIVNYYGLKESIDSANSLEYQQAYADIVNTQVFSTNVKSKGYKLSLSTVGKNEKRHLEIQIKDNASGVAYSIPISDKVDAESDYSAEIDIDKICIGGQINYSVKDGLKYAEAAVDAHATFKSTVKAEETKKILLCKTPVPLGNGIVGADIQIYVVLSVNGDITFEAELPVETSISYEKNKGLKNFTHQFAAENPKIKANCEVSAMLRFEPTFVILGCMNVMDAEADIGVSTSIEIIMHSNSQRCTDVAVSFPVMTLSVCGDDDVDTIIGDLGLSAQWEIVTSDEAPIHLGLHYELLPDKTEQYVDKCTYQEKEPSKAVKKETSTLRDTSEFKKFSTFEQPIDFCISEPFKDQGDYYQIKGNLQINYAVMSSVIDKLNKGDSFTVLDKEFILGERINSDDYPAYICSAYCVNDENTYYIPRNIPMDYGSRFGWAYFPICRAIPDYEFITETIEYLSDDLGSYEFEIPKDTFITSTEELSKGYFMTSGTDVSGLTEEEIFARDEEQRKEELRRIAHTAEECYENHVLIDDWLDIANYKSIYGEIDFPLSCYLTFNEDGVIDTIIWDSFR